MGRRTKRAIPEPRAILVVRLDEIGDVVLSTAFLRELRRNFPQAWITLIVKPATRNLVELCPHVNEVLTYEWCSPGRLSGLRRHARALALARRHLWPRRFDVALAPRRDVDYCHASFLAYFSGAPFRVGYSENVNDQKRQFNADFDGLFSHLLDGRTAKHEVQYSLDVIGFLGGHVREDGLELWLDGEDEAFAERVLRSSSAGRDDLLVTFGLGAGAPKRVWPVAKFTELGAWLVREYGSRIVVVGADRDGDLGDQLQRRLGDPVINLVGRSTLRQAGALLKRCQLFVGNDAGPMHLAAAAGVPVVEISCHPQNGSALHANSPRRFGPWGVPHVVLQPEVPREPCSEACVAPEAHCILEVSVERAKEAVRALASRQFASAPLNRGVLGAN
jgi:heptosyltransferase-2